MPPLNPKLEAKVSKLLAPDSRLEDTFSGKDLTLITDAQGYAVTLFLGKRNPDGSIQGERFVRRLKFAPDGVTLLASHWESKGKVYKA